MKRYQIILWTIIIAIIITIGIMAYNNFASKIEPIEINLMPPNNITPPVFPDFLVSVHPNGKIKFDDYKNTLANAPIDRRGISVCVRADKLDIPIQKKNAKELMNIIISYVNNTKLSHSTLLIGDGLLPEAGPFCFSWAPRLAIGLYQVDLHVLTDSGPLNYTWEFYVEQ